MRSKGFSFYFGSLGVETCSLDAALVPATVDNCLRATVVWVKWPCLWRVLQEWALLEVPSVAWRSFVSRGRRGTLWHSNVSHNVSKVVLCGRRSTFASFSQDELQFSWQAQHFGDLHRLFAWQAQHLRHVVLRFFFATPIVKAVRSGDKVQIPWQAWHFVTCAEKWRKPRTKHRFWGGKF